MDSKGNKGSCVFGCLSLILIIFCIYEVIFLFATMPSKKEKTTEEAPEDTEFDDIDIEEMRRKKFLKLPYVHIPWWRYVVYIIAMVCCVALCVLSVIGTILGEVNKDKMAITGNSRFGCWICTMVREDKSLLNFINGGSKELIPYRDFRNWLVSIRNDETIRDNKRRNGSVYEKEDGSYGLGPFNMEGRKIILEKLLELENVTGEELITIDELKAIDRIWEKEGDLYRRTLVELYYKVKGKRLPWDQYRTPMYSDDTMKIIDETCKEYSIEPEIIRKLLIAVESNKYYTRGNKAAKAFDKVINEGWLHHENIKSARKSIKNEN